MSASVFHAPRRHWYTVADYYRMAETGILSVEQRVELIEGEIIDMAPIGSRHAAVVDRLVRLLSGAVGDHAILRIQSPIRLGDQSEPQPDLTLLQYRDDFYASAHPGPKDVLLVVEIADTSLEYDRDTKLPLYARHSIPEAWLIDLTSKRIERYHQPSAQGYGEHVILQGCAAPLALPDCQIDLTGLV